MNTTDRFLRCPNQSFFLFGPRGTGKSTWLRGALPDAYFVDLLAPDLCQALTARPDRLREWVAGNADHRTFVLDEVQRVPAVLSVVHQLMFRSSRTC